MRPLVTKNAWKFRSGVLLFLQTSVCIATGAKLVSLQQDKTKCFWNSIFPVWLPWWEECVSIDFWNLSNDLDQSCNSHFIWFKKSRSFNPFFWLLHKSLISPWCLSVCPLRNQEIVYGIVQLGELIVASKLLVYYGAILQKWYWWHMIPYVYIYIYILYDIYIYIDIIHFIHLDLDISLH